MYTSKYCNTKLNGTPIQWREVSDEFKELLEARSMDEVREELSDTIYNLLCSIHTHIGLSLPMWGAYSTIYKILNRQKVWLTIFETEGLQFENKYLVNGSNYERPEKVKLAVELARKDQMKGELHNGDKLQ